MGTESRGRGGPVQGWLGSQEILRREMAGAAAEGAVRSPGAALAQGKAVGAVETSPPDRGTEARERYLTRWTAIRERGTCKNPLEAGRTPGSPPRPMTCLLMLAERARTENETPAWAVSGPAVAGELPPLLSLPWTASTPPL